MLNFHKAPIFTKFKFFSSIILERTISNFLSAEITFLNYSLDEIKLKYEIVSNKIGQNPHQKVFALDKNNVLIIPRIMDSSVELFYLPIQITRVDIGSPAGDFKIYNVIEATLTRYLTKSFKNKFEESIQNFGDALIKRIIAIYFCKGYYHPDKVIYLIDLFNKIRTTSFEGNYYKTGMILTKSDINIKKLDNYKLHGSFISLTRSTNIFNDDIDRRFWYIVNGVSSFYYCTRHHNINGIYVLGNNGVDSSSSFLDKMNLHNILTGGDVLFRIDSEKEMSIITSSRIEFIYLENHWKYRDYRILKALLNEKGKINDDVLNSLIYFILYCSKNKISTIIWIPKNENKIEDYLKSKNTLSKNNIIITNKSFTDLVIRCLSSDGAIIIAKDGKMLHYGCIINFESMNVKGVKGTGESAAGVLAENGISIKVSQDSSIKIFKYKNRKPILF